MKCSILASPGLARPCLARLGVAVSVCLMTILARPAYGDAVDDLARDFWTWRAAEQPVNTDDIPRLERPSGWAPHWSAADESGYKKQFLLFESQWKALDASRLPVSRQVDYRLLGSAIERVRWELVILEGWRRNPAFYVDQTAGAYMQTLVQPPPFSPERAADVLRILEGIPETLAQAKINLTEAEAPLAQMAIGQLDGLGGKVQRSAAALKPFLDASSARQADEAAGKCASAFDSYRQWLIEKLPTMSQHSAVGRDGYVFFLKQVALLPYTPEQLLAIGHQEAARSVASQTYEEHRNLGLPALSLPATQADEVERTKRGEAEVRRYLEDKDLLTVPAWTQHYRFAPMPAYLAPMEDCGEADDFTSPSRLNGDGIRYVEPPTDKLPYFFMAMARDPRPEIVHEGVPGHFFQLALSWKQPDLIRRHYYDSAANEGIGYYAEEMMLHAGFFDSSPRTREILWNFMRLRALRVEVDVKLALGEFSIPQAAQYLSKAVPMDEATARSEATFFASCPGQAISYQIGKQQIFAFLAEAQRDQGPAFSLRKFHDYLWVNGNVPISLLRWEYLGQRDDLDAVDRQGP